MTAKAPPSWLAPLTWPLSRLFALGVALKNAYYDHRPAAAQRLSRPVVSIGNLSMGGTGKTPVTIAVAQKFEALGQKVGIASRGYGRRDPQQTLLIDRNGSWQTCGDEPMMIAKRLPEVPIAVGPQRYLAADQLPLDKLDVVLLDDAFQHRQLARDLDLVLIDVTAGEPRHFPLKLFRETLPALRRCHAVLLTRWHEQADLVLWQKRIWEHVPNLPIFRVAFEWKTLRDQHANVVGTPQDLRGRRIGAFAGIAVPELFFNQLENAGAQLVAKHVLPDHHGFDSSELQRFLSTCSAKGAEWVVATEKDAVKLDWPSHSAILFRSVSQEVVWLEDRAMDQFLKHFTDRKVQP